MSMKVKYYMTVAGRSPVEEFVNNLPQAARLEIYDAIDLLEAGGASDNASKSQLVIHPARTS
jgi:hypothetical protein